jgi:hypothetical protein
VYTAWNKASSRGWGMDTGARHRECRFGEIEDLCQAYGWTSMTMRIPAFLHYLINPPSRYPKLRKRYIAEVLQRLPYNIKSSGRNITSATPRLQSALLHPSIYTYYYFD